MSDREWTRREGRLAYALCLSSWHANVMSEWPCDYHLGRARETLKILGDPEPPFTWEDVDRLMESPPDEPALTEIAQRLAATLPPRDPPQNT